MHFHQFFLLYLPLGSEIVESFHVTTSRQLNCRIVVPTAGNVGTVRARAQKPIVVNPKPLAAPGPERLRVWIPRMP